MVRAKLLFNAEVKGEAVPVLFDGWRCPCGYETVDGADMPSFMREAADVYRRNHDLLTSLELREARQARGMNQNEFADFLGVGSASVKRWEMGQVQDRAMDNLIRLKTDREAAYRNLCQIGDRSALLESFRGETYQFRSIPPMLMDTSGLPQVKDLDSIPAAA